MSAVLLVNGRTNQQYCVKAAVVQSRYNTAAQVQLLLLLPLRLLSLLRLLRLLLLLLRLRLRLLLLLRLPWLFEVSRIKTMVVWLYVEAIVELGDFVIIVT